MLLQKNHMCQFPARIAAECVSDVIPYDADVSLKTLKLLSDLTPEPFEQTYASCMVVKSSWLTQGTEVNTVSAATSCTHATHRCYN